MVEVSVEDTAIPDDEPFKKTSMSRDSLPTITLVEPKKAKKFKLPNFTDKLFSPGNKNQLFMPDIP